jgi:hypothetical protein
VHDGDLRDAGGREPRLVGEGAPAFHEHFGLIEQVRAAALHQIDQRQPVLSSDLHDA